MAVQKQSMPSFASIISVLSIVFYCAGFLRVEHELHEQKKRINALESLVEAKPPSNDPHIIKNAPGKFVFHCKLEFTSCYSQCNSIIRIESVEALSKPKIPLKELRVKTNNICVFACSVCAGKLQKQTEGYQLRFTSIQCRQFHKEIIIRLNFRSTTTKKLRGISFRKLAHFVPSQLDTFYIKKSANEAVF